MAPQCGICHTSESKYKCPICELRYCSINCYKQHKVNHAADEATKIQQIERAKRDRPGTTQRVPKVDFSGFEEDAEFKRLLSRYPRLKTQLQVLYGLTLEPGPDEARSWNRRPLYGDPKPVRQRFNDRGRGRGRGRGARAGRGGRGGGDVMGRDSRDEERQYGPWTQEKGGKEALLVMKRMRKGGSEDDLAEGLREFGELCAMKFGKERENG